MPVPKGFEGLVKLAMKTRPARPKSVDDLWEKFLRIVFMGGKRSEPETAFIIGMLKSRKLLDLDYVSKTGGDDWGEAVSALVDERVLKIKDEDALLMLKEFKKELFRVTASIKGSARWFRKNGITPESLAKTLDTKEKTWSFIEELVDNEDVSNIKYTKIIIWMHSIGYGFDFVPPTYQTKKFVNEDIGPYYQFYDDDKYFMKKAGEFAGDVSKKVKGATARDVSAAIYYYVTMKNFLPARSSEKKSCTPAMVVKFLKKKKTALGKLSDLLSDSETRSGLAQEFGEFAHKNM